MRRKSSRMRWRGSPMKRTRPGREIGEPADLVVNQALRVERQSVEGEIAPPRVGGEVAAEPHLGAAPVGLDVLAQGRGLDRPAVEDQRHRAVLDPGRREGDPRRLGAGDDDVGRRGGGEIEIAGRLAQQQVAHRAADQARLLAVAVQQRQRAGERRRRRARRDRRAGRR